MSYQENKSKSDVIKKFESRVLNRSCADLLFYDKIADYMLELFSTETKANTLSLISLLPLVVSYLVMLLSPQITWWHYLISVISIFAHQLFDIANKKQAYRLS